MPTIWTNTPDQSTSYSKQSDDSTGYTKEIDTSTDYVPEGGDIYLTTENLDHLMLEDGSTFLMVNILDSSIWGKVVNSSTNWNKEVDV